MKYDYDITIPAASQEEADTKASALARLAGQFDGPTLAALAAKGKAFLNDPAFGAMIRAQLGI